MKVKIRESLSLGDAAGRIDRAAGLIRGVRVCGPKSGNGRRYTPRALRNALPLYENARVFFDHPEGESNVRKFRERMGRLVNARVADDGGIDADLKYNPKHRDAEEFLWYVENDPAGMGLSHNAEGRGVREATGEVLVEEITKVHSVDIVDGPATNFSLFEQIREQDMPDPVVDPMAGATDSGDMDIDSKLSALVGDIAAHPDWDKATKLAKIKALVNLLEDKDADAKGEKKPADKEPSDDEMMEQLCGFKSAAVKKAHKILAREQARKQAAAKLPAELVTEKLVEQLAAAPLALREATLDTLAAGVKLAKVEDPKQPPPTGGEPVDVKKLAEQTWK